VLGDTLGVGTLAHALAVGSLVHLCSPRLTHARPEGEPVATAAP
jgi:hypothetical protein